MPDSDHPIFEGDDFNRFLERNPDKQEILARIRALIADEIINPEEVTAVVKQVAAEKNLDRQGPMIRTIAEELPWKQSRRGVMFLAKSEVSGDNEFIRFLKARKLISDGYIDAAENNPDRPLESNPGMSECNAYVLIDNKGVLHKAIEETLRRRGNESGGKGGSDFRSP